MYSGPTDELIASQMQNCYRYNDNDNVTSSTSVSFEIFINCRTPNSLMCAFTDTVNIKFKENGISRKTRTIIIVSFSKTNFFFFNILAEYGFLHILDIALLQNDVNLFMILVVSGLMLQL